MPSLRLEAGMTRSNVCGSRTMPEAVVFGVRGGPVLMLLVVAGSVGDVNKVGQIVIDDDRRLE